MHKNSQWYIHITTKMWQLFSAILFVSLFHYKNSMVFLWIITETLDCISAIWIWPLWICFPCCLNHMIAFFLSWKSCLILCRMNGIPTFSPSITWILPHPVLEFLNPLLKNSSLIKCLPVNTCFIHEPKDLYVSCPSPSVCQILQFKIITNEAEHM